AAARERRTCERQAHSARHRLAEGEPARERSLVDVLAVPGQLQLHHLHQHGAGVAGAGAVRRVANDCTPMNATGLQPVVVGSAPPWSPVPEVLMQKYLLLIPALLAASAARADEGSKANPDAPPPQVVVSQPLSRE